MTKRPEILIGVRGSWNTRPAAEIVTTSLKIPAMERVTTDVRCRRANSEAVMQKAMQPGKRRSKGPRMGPLTSTKVLSPSQSAGNPSTGVAMIRREANMIGAR